MRALLVGAVSTADKDQDPESQLRPLRALAERRGWAADAIPFKQSRFDEESAAEVRAAIMERLRAGSYDVLAVWGWDRLSREGIEAAFSFLRELEDHLGVRFYSLQEPFLCTDAPREQRELLLAIIAWAAKWESQRKSDRLVAKAETKREASAKLGQRAVWGKGKMATPEEVEAVKVGHAMGGSVREIARTLNLSKSQVARILAGEVKSATVPSQAAGRERAHGEKSAPAAGGGPGQASESGQNIVPVPIVPARRAEMPARGQAVTDGGA